MKRVEFISVCADNQFRYQISFLRMRKDAIRCVTDEPNLQVSHLAYLGQNCQNCQLGLTRTSGPRSTWSLNAASAANSCIHPLISLPLVQNWRIIPLNEVGATGLRLASVRRPRGNQVFQICSCVNGAAGHPAKGEKVDFPNAHLRNIKVASATQPKHAPTSKKPNFLIKLPLWPWYHVVTIRTADECYNLTSVDIKKIILMIFFLTVFLRFLCSIALFLGLLSSYCCPLPTPPPLFFFSDSKRSHGSVAVELSHSGRTQGVCGEKGSTNAAAFTQQWNGAALWSFNTCKQMKSKCPINLASHPIVIRCADYGLLKLTFVMKFSWSHRFCTFCGNGSSVYIYTVYI